MTGTKLLTLTLFFYETSRRRKKKLKAEIRLFAFRNKLASFGFSSLDDSPDGVFHENSTFSFETSLPFCKTIKFDDPLFSATFRKRETEGNKKVECPRILQMIAL